MKDKITSLENSNIFNISTSNIDISKHEVVLILYAHNHCQYGVDTLTIPMSKIISGSIDKMLHVVQAQGEYSSSFIITITNTGVVSVDATSTNQYYIPYVEIYVK